MAKKILFGIFISFGNFLVLWDFLRTPREDFFGVLGASFRCLLGILVASLQCPRLGYPRLGLDLAKLG